MMDRVSEMVIEMLFTNRKNQFITENLDIVKILDKEIDELTLSYAPDSAFRELDSNIFMQQSNLLSYHELYYYGIFCDFSSDLKWHEINYKNKKYGLAIYINNDSIDINNNFVYIKIVFHNNKTVKNLYELKILIKDKLREFYKHFYWLWDDQAKRFNITCYNKIFDIENQMRRLLTASFIKLFGIEWWEEKAPKELKLLAHRYSKNSGTIGGKTWKNVQHYIYNINVDNLLDLMKKERAELEVSNEELGQLFKACNKNEEILELKRKTQKYSLWDEYFSKLLEDKEFPNKWVEFTSYRNFVAHNKFMDYKAFVDFQSLYKYLNAELYKAYTRLPQISLSDIDLLRISLLLEADDTKTQKFDIKKANRITSYLENYEYILQEEILPLIISFCEWYDYNFVLETISLSSSFVVIGTIKGISAKIEVDKVININEKDEVYRFGVVLQGTNNELDYLFPIPLRMEEDQVFIDNKDELINDFKQALWELIPILESTKIPFLNWENTPLIYDDSYEILDEYFFEEPEEELYFGVIEGYHYESVHNNGQARNLNDAYSDYDDEIYSDNDEVERYYLEYRDDFED